jgi:hypothetical protein
LWKTIVIFTFRNIVAKELDAFGKGSSILIVRVQNTNGFVVFDQREVVEKSVELLFVDHSIVVNVYLFEYFYEIAYVFQMRVQQVLQYYVFKILIAYTGVSLFLFYFTHYVIWILIYFFILVVRTFGLLFNIFLLFLYSNGFSFKTVFLIHLRFSHLEYK